MISASRQAICEGLVELGEHSPDMRFGQLVEMVALLASRDTPQAAYDIDDRDFLAAVRRHLEQIESGAAPAMRPTAAHDS